MKFNPNSLKKIRLNCPGELNQASVAGLLGIKQSAYSRKESGQSPITIAELEQLAEIFGVDLVAFFDGDGTPAPAEKGGDNKMGEIEKEYYKMMGRYEELEKRFNELLRSFPVSGSSAESMKELKKET